MAGSGSTSEKGPEGDGITRAALQLGARRGELLRPTPMRSLDS